ncbi:MAG TPA: hypothetical protein VMR41_04460 [Patescibacteria group bacterium]|nr:hypothetical protein [Patescibacteria group bacterium]
MTIEYIPEGIPDLPPDILKKLTGSNEYYGEGERQVSTEEGKLSDLIEKAKKYQTKNPAYDVIVLSDTRPLPSYEPDAIGEGIIVFDRKKREQNRL